MNATKVHVVYLNDIARLPVGRLFIGVKIGMSLKFDSHCSRSSYAEVFEGTIVSNRIR